MKFPKHINHMLFLIMVLSVLINRYPLFYHEWGSDTYIINVSSDSLIDYGLISWYLNPLSYFGWYPHSYASGTIVLLATTSMLIGIEMEYATYLIPTFMSLFSMFAIYILARQFFKQDDLSPFVVAIIFNSSRYIHLWTWWNANSRGIFTLFLPIFLYSIFRASERPQNRQFLLLPVIFTLCLFSLHRMALLIVISVFLPLLITIIIYRIDKKARLPRPLYFIFLVPLVLPMFNIYILSPDTKLPIVSDFFTFVDLIWSLGVTYMKLYSFYIIFIPVAFIGLLLKSRKSFSDIFLIVFSSCFMLLYYELEYFPLFALPLVAILTAKGIHLMQSFSIDRNNLQIGIAFFVISLICFSLIILETIIKYHNYGTAFFSLLLLLLLIYNIFKSFYLEIPRKEVVFAFTLSLLFFSSAYDFTVVNSPNLKWQTGKEIPENVIFIQGITQNTANSAFYARTYTNNFISDNVAAEIRIMALGNVPSSTPIWIDSGVDENFTDYITFDPSVFVDTRKELWASARGKGIYAYGNTDEYIFVRNSTAVADIYDVNVVLLGGEIHAATGNENNPEYRAFHQYLENNNYKMYDNSDEIFFFYS